MNNRWRMGMRAGLMLPPVQYGGFVNLGEMEIEQSLPMRLVHIRMMTHWQIEQMNRIRRKYAMLRVQFLTMREDKRKVRPWQL